MSKNMLKDFTKDLMIQGHLEHLHLRNKRNNIYIALEKVEDTDFFWSNDEIQIFDELWYEDKPITDIAREMRRTDISVFLLAMDRVFRGKVNPRKGWKIW